MQNDCIEITGITPDDMYPKLCQHCYHHYPHIQICETDKLCIPKNKPNIESICQVFVSTSIKEYKIICTPFGKKLVIEGKKHIKIIYTADEPCQNMHCAKFEIPFCTYVLLKNICKEIIDVFIGIEYINVHQINCNCFTISLIFNAIPIFKKEKIVCDKKNTCNPQVNCDIHINCCNNDEFDNYNYSYNN